MSREKGMIRKYNVECVDGKPMEFGCMVMQWDDANARAAIRTYSKEVRADGYTVLADELDERLGHWSDLEELAAQTVFKR